MIIGDHNNITPILKLSSNRSFGYTFSTVFLLIASFKFVARHHGSAAIWVLASIGCALITITIPHILLPFNKIWHTVGLLLHRITTPLIMGFIFYFIVTPMGFIMRLFGWDPLRLKLDHTVTSYWINKDPKLTKMTSMTNQF